MGKRAKLRGALLAYAIGDALGKGTEFMNRNVARRRYPNGLRRYSDIFQDAHRSQWSVGQWTNDTDLIINMAKGIIADNGNLLVRHQAQILRDWFLRNPLDVVPCMRIVLSNPSYVSTPLQTAERVWHEETFDPSNEALGRAMLAGMASGEPETNAKIISSLTNPHQVCEGTAMLIGRMAHDLFHHDGPTPKQKMMELAQKYHKTLPPFMREVYGHSLNELELDDPDTLSDVRKSGSAALWAVMNCQDAAEALFMLVDAGGDSDTNAALGAALVAMRDDGNLNIPQHLIDELQNREELENTIEALADIWNLTD